MKKVLRIIARMNMGGPARHCLLLGRGLLAHGFETVLLAGDLDAGEVSLLGGNGAPEPIPGFRTEHIPGLGRPPSPVDDLRALRRILRVIRRERPDVVHTHTAKAGALGRIAARLAGVPVVVHTFHGHVLSGYFSPAGSQAVTLAERALSKLTSRIVTLSPGLRDELAGRFGVAPLERFEVVPLGRDIEAIQAAESGSLRAELQLPPDALVVGCVGRLVPIKRVPAVVRAFAGLARENSKAHLVIVGDGPERAAVEAEVLAQSLGGRVHLLGWRRDLPKIYADLDLLALASRNEGTPLAMIEAFAAGVPVVAPSVGGIPDMFGRRQVGGPPIDPPPAGVSLRAQGALVPGGDDVALGEGLRFFADRPWLREQASARAREASLAYDGRRLVDETAALYTRLLAERGR